MSFTWLWELFCEPRRHVGGVKCEGKKTSLPENAANVTYKVDGVEITHVTRTDDPVAYEDLTE